VMKCCIHHVLPSGHVIPFCAYNVLYRDGHVVLPQLRDAFERPALPPSPHAREFSASSSIQR
jgi:7,8-dihydro-6-hydroxymethylpterin dimethyltransferase